MHVKGNFIYVSFTITFHVSKYLDYTLTMCGMGDESDQLNPVPIRNFVDLAVITLFSVETYWQYKCKEYVLNGGLYRLIFGLPSKL
jgi:hypothetical protein